MKKNKNTDNHSGGGFYVCAGCVYTDGNGR